MIGRFEKAILGLTTLLAAATGILVGVMKYLLRPADPFSVVNHPWQPAALSAHVLAAPLMLFSVGLITREHIVGRYRNPRARRGRRTGAFAALVLIPMVVSGYLVQVLVTRESRSLAGAIHLGAGLVFLAVYAAHRILAGRNGRRGEIPIPKSPETGRDRTGAGARRRSGPVREPALKRRGLVPIIETGRGATVPGRKENHAKNPDPD